MNISFNNKKLLVISHSYSNFIKDQVEALSCFFKHVYVVVRHNPIADISKYVPINNLKPFRSSSIIDLNDKPDNISVIVTNIMYLPTKSQYKKLGEKHFRVIDKIIMEKNISFDLIHAHFTWTAGYVGVKLKNKYKVPFVLTVHENRDWFLEEFKSGESDIYYVWENADRIIRVNKVDIPLLKKFNNNVISIPNGINKKLFYKFNSDKARQNLNLPQNGKIILSVGQLIKRKGFDYLIEAFSSIICTNSDLICIICGQGEQKKHLDRKIKKLGIYDRVKMVGFVPHNNLFLWINACDLFVMPSLSESFGLVQVEAMACGKPVIATYNGGSEEIITSDEHGLLCKSADSEELANKIICALKKEWDNKKIVEYTEQFDWGKIAIDILQVYGEIV